MSKRIQVGKVKEYRHYPLSNIYYTYRDVKYNAEKWANSAEYLPAEYDICILQLKDNIFKKGWHNGIGWDGLHVKHTDVIESWKKSNEIIDHRS